MVVNAAITLKCLEPNTGKLWAETTVNETFSLCACSDLALRTPRMDIEDSRPTSLTSEVLRSSSLANRFRQEMFTFWKRGVMVIANTAVEATHTYQ